MKLIIASILLSPLALIMIATIYCCIVLPVSTKFANSSQTVDFKAICNRYQLINRSHDMIVKKGGEVLGKGLTQEKALFTVYHVACVLYNHTNLQHVCSVVAL